MVTECATPQAPRPGDTLVLVAEDDADLRAVFVDAFVHAGYRVVGIPDGDKLSNMLQGLSSSQPVVVVTDQRMPHAWGMDCLAQHGGELSFIVVTGHADSALRAMAAHYGASAVFEKPADIDMLIEAVARASRAV